MTASEPEETSVVARQCAVAASAKKPHPDPDTTNISTRNGARENTRTARRLDLGQYGYRSSADDKK